MRPIGFSSGALAYSDFRRAVQVARQHNLPALELSALRDHEVGPLLDALPDLNLEGIAHLSFHAPSRLTEWSETDLVSHVLEHVPQAWPVVVHPDVIENHQVWKPLGNRLCIENMDQRKECGRTAEELRPFFANLPDATFCLDLAHAHQIDPTMSVATDLLRAYGDRLKQVHCSELRDDSSHGPMSFRTLYAYRRIADLLPVDCPVIIEAVVAPEEVTSELDITRLALTDKASFDEWRQHAGLASHAVPT
ncbi:MAG: hypothetical protein WD534_15005 [Phycisphaeraceae bacterium]